LTAIADGLDDLGGVADDVAADNAIGRAIHDQLHQDAVSRPDMVDLIGRKSVLEISSG